MSSASSLEQEIRELKKERNAIILAHYYQDSDIQDMADGIGDSYYLSKVGQSSTADVIVLAGVVFMAESVKILSPEKTVLVPDLDAGCSLVSDTPTEEFRKWREAHPNAVAVTYINSSTEVKALSDVICTSSNAEKIIRSIPQDREILFAPDRNLGRYIQTKTGRQMTLWPGACEVHVLFSAQMLEQLTRKYPEALVLAHPECEEAVLAYADVIGATSALLAAVNDKSVRQFIVVTEDGIIHQMKRARPDAEFIPAPVSESCLCNRCPYMKKNSLEKIRDALLYMKPAISISESLRQKAQGSLNRMLDITEGKSVDFH
ncbi:MAG: quinolinate synthase NadA [Bdellovibrionales bacterium]